MTFELRRRHLGRVAFDPAARAATQDPFRLRDYRRQMRRWTLGFWQTIRRHRLHRDRFSLALGSTIVELVVSSIVLLAMAVVFTAMVLSDILGHGAAHISALAAMSHDLHRHVSYGDFGVVAGADYLLTCVVALIQRRPRYLVLGITFLALRLFDSYAALSSIPRAWSMRSTGRWRSPQRHPAQTAVALASSKH